MESRSAAHTPHPTALCSRRPRTHCALWAAVEERLIARSVISIIHALKGVEQGSSRSSLGLPTKGKERERKTSVDCGAAPRTRGAVGVETRGWNPPQPIEKTIHKSRTPPVTSNIPLGSDYFADRSARVVRRRGNNHSEDRLFHFPSTNK
jgi:hypothetical protein